MDGKDLAARRSHGKVVFFIQSTGREGTRYQDHSSIELSKLDENVAAANIEISHRAFFLPGDYQLAVALFDTAAGEHSATQAPFRIAVPADDFLPNAWRDLPAIEFIGSEQSPDSWYLPYIRGRLQWVAALHSPARLGVILI